MIKKCSSQTKSYEDMEHQLQRHAIYSGKYCILHAQHLALSVNQAHTCKTYLINHISSSIYCVWQGWPLTLNLNTFNFWVENCSVAITLNMYLKEPEKITRKNVKTIHVNFMIYWLNVRMLKHKTNIKIIVTLSEVD